MNKTPSDINWSDIRKQFLIPDEDLRFRFNYDNVGVLQEDFYTKSAALNNMFYITPNEKRVQLGLEEIAMPEMDMVYIPMGMQPIEGSMADPDFEAPL